MSSDNLKHEICKVILSLLLARKGATPVTILDQDYYEMEGENIPWQKFGYVGLVMFLRSMPQYFEVKWYNNCYYVRGIASDKSKHVSSLVARQKWDMKTKNLRFRQSHRSNNQSHTQYQQFKISAEQLYFLVQYIKNHPEGLSIQNIMIILKKQLPQVMLSVHEVRKQLRELSHQLVLDGEMIYSVSPNNASQESMNRQKFSKPMSQDQSYLDHQAKVLYAGDENSVWMKNYNIDQNNSSKAKTTDYPTNQLMNKQFVANINRKQMYEQNDYNKNINEHFTNNSRNIVMSDNNSSGKMPNNRCIDMSILINDRTKSRLKQLMQKHPDGIYCADLPNKYLNEYKVHLNYTELGFSSVCEYVSNLPNIFCMTRVNATNDFILFSVDKKSTIPDQETFKNQITESLEIETSKLHDEHNSMQYIDDEAIPKNISPSITSKFIPVDVMNYNNKVDLISVTNLQHKKLEVYIVEVFTPSFFWIHLRENTKSLQLFMKTLHYFYENNKESYIIPKVALNKGLNCACLFAHTWHRAIIKNVKPDFKVTVFFYDYGTLKTYEPDEVYYLHKQFSFLPAQAIPCGLHNIKPYVGDRWKKSVTEQFMDKTSNNLLVATVSSIDPTYNSMMIVLIDTSEKEDVNLNDWFVNQNLAQQGKPDSTVDMTNLMKYVLNNTGQLPMYCYAEENLADYCSKTTSTEDMHKISSELSYDNNQQQQSLNPPSDFPSFKSLNFSLENILFFDKMKTTNPFLDNQLSDSISTNIVKQIFMQTWKENAQLQIKISMNLFNLLKHSTIKKSIFESYLIKQHQINNILKDMEKILANDDEFIADASAINFVNKMTSHEIDPKSKTLFHSNDEFALDVSSNLSNQLDVDNKSTNQIALLNLMQRNLDDFTFKSNCSESISEFSPHSDQSFSQMPLTISPILDNYKAATSPSFQKTDHENKNVLSMKSMSSNISINKVDSNNNSSSFLSNKTNISNNVHKETNPFRTLSMTEKIQVQETQSKQKINNYNPSSTYLSAINVQNHTSNMESVKVYPKTETFLSTMYACDVHNDGINMPKIVYKPSSILQDRKKIQKKEANINTMYDVFCNFDNTRMTSSMSEQCSKELSSQLANDTFSSKNSYGTYIDDGYAIQSSTNHNQQNSSLMSNELKDQKDLNMNKLLSNLQHWKKVEIPERWVNSKFENDNFSRIYNSKTVTTSINVPLHQNCDNDKQSTSQDSTNDYTSQVNNELMNRHRYIENTTYEKSETSIQENLFRNTTSNLFLKHCFLFHKIDTVKGVTFIFYMEENGWILTHEFITTFTNYVLYTELIAIINMMKIRVLFKEINRADYPVEFLQLDRFLLDVPRNEENHITSINLISLQSALLLLHKLKIISREEMDNAFKRNQFQDNSVLLKMWSLILTYRQLKQHIEKSRVAMHS